MSDHDFTIRYGPVHGYPGYRVGDDGSVWSRVRIKGRGRGRSPEFIFGEWKRLKTPADAHGRLKVNIGRNRTRYVARLVLEAFIGKCPPGKECCHFPDSDPANCKLSNLRWGTSRDNTNDQRSHGTLVGGERHGMSRLSNEDINAIKSMAGTKKQREIAELFGVTQPHISAILNEKKRTKSSHNGKGLR